MGSVSELYGAAVAMQHAGLPWHQIARRLEVFAPAGIAPRVVFEIAFATGESIRFDGSDWVYVRVPGVEDAALAEPGAGP